MLKMIEDVSDDDNWFYQLANGDYILIEYDGDATVYHIDVPDENCNKLSRIGSIEFEQYEEGSRSHTVAYSKVMHMDLGDCGRRFLKQGIGTEILKIKETMEHLPIIFGNDDGTKSEDGSHLIDDGLPFARAFNKKRKPNGFVFI